ncbi:MAG: hypothetical protein JST12_03200 [Armatimonadetes bacterium]|nr:hypothetical protein [Armatimonadota bacterium]
MSSYPVHAYPSPRAVMSFQEYIGWFAKAERWHFSEGWDHFETRATMAEYSLWVLQEPKRWLLDGLPVDEALNVLETMPRPSGDNRLPKELRLEIARAELNVFEQIFEPLICGPVTDSYSKLTSLCFMWWDLGGWKDPEIAQVFREIFATLLQSSCRAIQEAALHGLGHHICLTSDPLAKNLVDRFLETHQGADHELIRYARSARNGNVL